MKDPRDRCEAVARLAALATIGLLALGQPSSAGPIRVVLAGDTSFGESYQEEIAERGGDNVLVTKGYEHSIAKVGPLLQRADLTIINLETPLTELRVSPLLGKPIYHWGDAGKTIAMLKRYGVDAVSLANNHALDLGLDGFEDTILGLAGANIAWFGAGTDEAEAARPLIRHLGSLTLALIGAFERHKTYEQWAVYAHRELPGVRALDVEVLTEQIRALRSAQPEAFIVITPHWGHGYRWRNDEQAKAAHRLVDEGADMVIGHGSHVMQEIEFYKGRWIVYGLGNLVFNSEGEYGDRGSLPFSLVLELEIDEDKAPAAVSGFRLYPILSDNTLTGYQPRFLDVSEFSKAAIGLLAKSSLGDDFALTRAETDEIGPYIWVSMSK